MQCFILLRYASTDAQVGDGLGEVVVLRSAFSVVPSTGNRPVPVSESCGFLPKLSSLHRAADQRLDVVVFHSRNHCESAESTMAATSLWRRRAISMQCITVSSLAPTAPPGLYTDSCTRNTSPSTPVMKTSDSHQRNHRTGASQRLGKR
jgi:hypothetical protein